jgi:broad specificity phosphatase PhoE
MQTAGRYQPTNQAIKHRARAARQWLKARPEKEVIVVSHGGILHYLTEDWEDSSQYQGMSGRAGGWIRADDGRYRLDKHGIPHL